MAKIKKVTNKRRSSKKISTKKRSIFKFLPAIIVSVLAFSLWAEPHLANYRSADYKEVLAYATNTNREGLLAATNQQRSAHGVGTLSLNSKLNSAAQAKANDMVNRNYWSHQTPDGQDPWIFITQAGYHYLSAGENLAYGFTTSSTTITGWMNSPSHKANLLSGTYVEVGFGIANSPDFVNKGPNTVVVAMYGKPQSSQPIEQPAPAQPQPQPQPVVSREVKSSDNQASTPSKPAPVQPTPTPQPEEDTTEGSPEDQPTEKAPATTMISYTSDGNQDSGQESKEIKRVHILTKGRFAWSATIIVLLICAIGLLWSIHRGYRLAQIIKHGKQIIGKNLHIDLLILATIFLAYVLLSTSGVIK